ARPDPSTMPSYPLRALVLRKTKLGETDVIVTLLAENGRQVRAVAKGMRKPTSKFAGRLEPYSEVDLLMHEGRSLDVVSEAQTLDAHAALREDFDRSTAAAVVADVLDKIAVEAQAEERLFGLAHASLAAMESADADGLHALVVAFLVKAMAMHGYRPVLDACATCACEAGATRLFSLQAGGVVCLECGTADAAALHFTPEARAWLTALLGATMADVGGLGIPDAAVRDCFTLVRSFVTYHLPARLKALEFYAGVLG
ncbi:MAG: DNA repair protein RecO, partial [Actinomycetota bacterium]|nr:DNA repair protein RecO [Actinomycetota bacterium]